MRLRLALAPVWVIGLLQGSFFGLGMTLFSRFQTEAWLPALISGVVGGLIFGLFMGPYTRQTTGALLGEMSGWPHAEIEAAIRASRRGPAPPDPRLRAAARNLVQRHHNQTLRIRTPALVLFSVLLVLYVVLAVARSGWWTLAAVAVVVLLVTTLRAPARARRRMELLADQPSPQARG